MKKTQPLLIDSNERGPLHDAIVRAVEREGYPVKKYTYRVWVITKQGMLT